MSKRRRKNPSPAGRVRPSRTFVTRIPGVNISISLQPTKRGVMIVKPRVSRVTISRGRENPRRRRRNPLQLFTTPGRVTLQRVGTTTRSFV